MGHRLTYYSAHEAEKKNSANEIARNQINDLLHDIIPPRVTEVIRVRKAYQNSCFQIYPFHCREKCIILNLVKYIISYFIECAAISLLQEKRTYSQNHENVGVIFGSIINFNEFYEEAFAGGKECIRVLNELIGERFFEPFF